jgi:hypothetical protein
MQRVAPHPFLIEVQGGSMEPTLSRGSLVLVDRRRQLPAASDVIVVRGQDRLIVHRVVHVAALRSGVRVYHAGDAAGAIGRCTRHAVLGRVAAVVDPGDTRAASLRPLSAAARRRLRWARWRCEAEAAMRALVD